MTLWPFKRARDPDPRDSDALAAQIHADIQHKTAQQELTAAHRIAAEMRKVRERNHFGQSLQSLYDGNKA